MYKLIHKIRGKSKATRRLAAFSVSLGITGIFGFFWALSYAEYSDRILNSKAVGEPNKAIGIWKEMTAKIGDSYANFNATTKNLGKGAEDAGSGTDQAASNSDASSSGLDMMAVPDDSIDSSNPASGSYMLNTNTETANDKATTSSEVLVQ